VVHFVHEETGGRLPIIGVGGIMDADDAARLFDAGASLVQLYTGFVYRARPGGRARSAAPDRRRAACRPAAGRRTPSELLALDRAHVWHPVRPDARAHRPVRGRERRGRPADAGRRPGAGRRDVVVVGGHPRLPAPGAGRRAGRAVRPDEPRHVRRLTHAPAVELATTLVELTPDGLEHVFLCDSGSVGVEVAIKMALQAQRRRAAGGRLATWRGRLPRRHVPPDERLRPGRRHALAVDRRAARAGLRRPPPAEFDAAYAAELPTWSSGTRTSWRR
jgi:hypothetical protein